MARRHGIVIRPRYECCTCRGRSTMSKALPGIVSAYQFDQQGVARRLADDEVADAIDRLRAEGGGWCWIHLNLGDQRLTRLAPAPRASAR
ncbi:MAG: hypothetical protein QM674_15165 [Burkholderiaceae bacterium]